MTKNGAEVPYNGAVEYAVRTSPGGIDAVAAACGMGRKGVEKWIMQEAKGQNPLRVAQYWRVIALAELSGVTPWKLTRVPMPKKFLTDGYVS
jgi:hypothetical protein